MFSLLCESLYEGGFVQAVAFANQPFGSVTVNGVVKLSFWCNDEHLYARGVFVAINGHPMYAQWKKQLAVGRAVELFYEHSATEFLTLWEAVIMIGGG